PMTNISPPQLCRSWRAAAGSPDEGVEPGSCFEPHRDRTWAGGPFARKLGGLDAEPPPTRRPRDGVETEAGVRLRLVAGGDVGPLADLVEGELVQLDRGGAAMRPFGVQLVRDRPDLSEILGRDVDELVDSRGRTG